MKNATLVIGASPKPERYAFKAIEKLRAHDHPVRAVALRPGKVADVEFETECRPHGDVDTITLYVGPQRQSGYLDYIISLNPRRVIFNPGTENPEFQQRLRDEGIEALEACTLVLLATDQY